RTEHHVPEEAMPDFAQASVEEAPRRGRPPRDPNAAPRARRTPSSSPVAGGDGSAPRRRGRPKGSKNKPKVAPGA
ncbi:MAG: hypothetical protein KGR25_01020, partial [Chloroflexi bacterium]|nr:hypothetical protein [Chloroflexota bacterium]